MIAIHVGLRKCASASIQMFLSENENSLRKLGVDYPSVGRAPRRAHHNIAYETYGSSLFRPDAGSLADLAAHWRRSPYEAMILSSEMFERATERGAQRLKAKLVTDRFAIIVVMRELLDLMPSSYAQKVKYGLHTYNFDEFFDERMGESRVNYFDTVGRWAKIFGWQSVHIRLLDSACDANGDIFDDLLSTMGLDAAAVGGTLRRPGRVNAAPGWKVLEAVRALYVGAHGLPAEHPLLSQIPHSRDSAASAAEREEHFKRVGRPAMKVGEALGWNTDKGLYLTRVQAQRCIELYRDSIEALNKHLPTPLPLPVDVGYRDFVERQFLPDVRHIPPDEVRDFYGRLADYLAARHEREIERSRKDS